MCFYTFKRRQRNQLDSRQLEGGEQMKHLVLIVHLVVANAVCALAFQPGMIAKGVVTSSALGGFAGYHLESFKILLFHISVLFAAAENVASINNTSLNMVYVLNDVFTGSCHFPIGGKTSVCTKLRYPYATAGSFHGRYIYVDAFLCRYI